MSMQPTACPSGDEKVKLFALLLETNARLSRSLSAELEEGCELPLPWFEVLLQLRQAPEGRLKMNQVADAIVHSTGGTTRLIDRLEEAGFVERQLCPKLRMCHSCSSAVTPNISRNAGPRRRRISSQPFIAGLPACPLAPSVYVPDCGSRTDQTESTGERFACGGR